MLSTWTCSCVVFSRGRLNFVFFLSPTLHILTRLSCLITYCFIVLVAGCWALRVGSKDWDSAVWRGRTDAASLASYPAGSMIAVYSTRLRADTYLENQNRIFDGFRGTNGNDCLIAWFAYRRAQITIWNSGLTAIKQSLSFLASHSDTACKGSPKWDWTFKPPKPAEALSDVIKAIEAVINLILWCFSKLIPCSEIMVLTNVRAFNHIFTRYYVMIYF